RGAAAVGHRGHGAAHHREGPRRRVHHRPHREGWAHHHRAQHGAAAEFAGEARARGGGAADRQGADTGVTTESPIRALRADYDAIARKLGSVAGAAEREAVKREIIAYFKQVDALIAELGELREDIRKLVDRYKQVAASTAEASAPEFTGSRPALHADHIGASTFIEKGWSLISLGDYAGAIQSLQKALQLAPGETQGESLLGWAQMLHEDYDETLKLGPNLIEAYYELGRAYWFGGEAAQAQQVWEDGFKANKFNPWGKKCQDTLQVVLQGGEPPRT